MSTMTTENEIERVHGSLHSLAMTGDAENIKRLLQEHPSTDVNELDEYVSYKHVHHDELLSESRWQGYTPLHLACDRGHKEVVQLLLRAGADTGIKVCSELSFGFARGSVDQRIKTNSRQSNWLESRGTVILWSCWRVCKRIRW